jgi:CheY-like chemotaxis protein
LSRRRVLVVEDEVAIALDLAKLVRDYGAAIVGIASSADEAVAQITQTRIHCVVLDVKLGSDDCSSVAQILADRHIPFVFVTGYSNSEVVSGYSAPVIRKPYTPIDVINRLKAVLAT